MKKIISILIALAVVAGISVNTLAFIPRVSGNGTSITRTIKTENGSRTVSGISYPDQAKEVLRLMNIERKAEGLPTLAWEPELESAAVTRAIEQELLRSHSRPDGTEWYTVSQYANGENVAGGDTNAADVMVGWMNSPGHRANILEADFTSVAVACVETENMVYWSQIFHSNKSKVTPNHSDSNSSSSSASSGGNASGGTGTAAASSGDASAILSALDAANTAQATTVSASMKNLAGVSPATLSEMVKWGTAKGKTTRLVANTSYGSGTGVQGQISLYPASFSARTTDLSLGVYVEADKVSAVTGKMNRWYSNNLVVIHMDEAGALGAPVHVAAKADLTGLDTAALTFYAYNPAANTVTEIKSPAYSIDASGYLHFDTSVAGDIVVTNGALAK